MSGRRCRCLISCRKVTRESAPDELICKHYTYSVNICQSNKGELHSDSSPKVNSGNKDSEPRASSSLFTSTPRQNQPIYTQINTIPILNCVLLPILMSDNVPGRQQHMRSRFRTTLPVVVLADKSEHDQLETL
jgi:hypothetical protein